MYPSMRNQWRRRLMVFADDDAEAGADVPLRTAAKRDYGLEMKNRRVSAEDFGSTSEEDDMILHPLESVLKQIRERPLPSKRWAYCCSGVVFAGLVGLMIGFTMAYGLFLSLEAPCAHLHVWLTGSDDMQQRVTEMISGQRIADTLRVLTKRPHLAGTPADEELVEFVANRWRQQGFDSVSVDTYDVLLSYPNKTRPNLVRILDEKSDVVFECKYRQPPLHSPEESRKDVPQNFNAYSATGNVKGRYVYANYGTREDFELLRRKNITVVGHIVIARYGQIFRGNKVENCQLFGCLGMVLYSDPADYAPEGPRGTYPASRYLPPNGAQLGTVYLDNGDPLTPFYPSIPGSFRIDEANASIPRIPVQPIGANDAALLISLLQGGSVAVPDDWRGGLNVSYHFGPGPNRDNWLLNLDIGTHTQRANVSNVVAILRGREEPDRYVLAGNHRDAWIFGAVDPSSGTAAMLELSRTLMLLHQQTGWRPRRSLVFCSWGAEEYGLVGSTEWVQHKRQQLMNNAVAYINVDLTLNGNKTFRALSVPLLYDVLYSATRAVANPDPQELQRGRATVFDTWLVYRNSSRPGVPRVGLPGSGSDYAPFLSMEGVPVADIRYDSEDGRPYPLYHTLYETFFYTSHIEDSRSMSFTAAIATVWSQLLIRLADDDVLPFNVVTYAVFLQEAVKAVSEHYGSQLAKHGLSLKYLNASAVKFRSAAEVFHVKVLYKLDRNNVFELRRVNDVLMMIERWFIEPRGLPGRPQHRHLVFSPSSSDSYDGMAFPGLVDLLYQLARSPPPDRATVRRKIELHLSVLSYVIEGAADALLWKL